MTTKKMNNLDEAFREINLDEILADGIQKMKLRKYREAIRSLQTVTEMVPEHIDAWNNLGVAYLLLEEYGEAELALRSGLEQDLENPQLIKNLIQALLPQETKAAEGMSLLLKFLELRPQDPDALYMLGRCLDAAGEKMNADLIYQHILEIKPDYKLAVEALTSRNKSI